MMEEVRAGVSGFSPHGVESLEIGIPPVNELPVSFAQHPEADLAPYENFLQLGLERSAVFVDQVFQAVQITIRRRPDPWPSPVVSDIARGEHVGHPGGAPDIVQSQQQVAECEDSAGRIQSADLIPRVAAENEDRGHCSGVLEEGGGPQVRERPEARSGTVRRLHTD
jgi:hypothetical protein